MNKPLTFNHDVPGMDDITAHLRSWALLPLADFRDYVHLKGRVFYDKMQRFMDGDLVSTSPILKVSSKGFAWTKNSIYKLDGEHHQFEALQVQLHLLNSGAKAFQPTHQHLPSGSLYELVMERCLVMTRKDSITYKDGDTCTLYRNEDGSYFVRESQEFIERFKDFRR